MSVQNSGRMIDELNSWLERNWNPLLPVAEWWTRLGLAGWSAPALPVEWHGRGATREDAIRVQQRIAEFGALGAPGGLGLLLAAPTIAVHGSDDQKRSYLRDIVTGSKAWCQLFSEPGAGSDLAGLTTKAERDGDEWIVNGQKVWTSTAQTADLGMLLARTNADAPKHKGITYFVLDMHQPGVDVRPLREMTGRALFSEVFLSDVRVRDGDAIGGVDSGWGVANTTLAFERSGLGAGGAGGGPSVAAGQTAGNLTRRAGEFVSERRAETATAKAGFGAPIELLLDIASENGSFENAVIRQDLMRLYTLTQIARFTNLRARAARKAGKELPGLANLAKLTMSGMQRLSRDTSMRIVGAAGMLHGYTPEARRALEEAVDARALEGVTDAVLWAQASSIYGGTDEIQRNIIGERVLGLPREPTVDRETSFRDLPRNG